MPVYLDVNFMIMPTRISPFVNLKGGYVFSISEGLTGVGLLFAPHAGVNFKSRSSSGKQYYIKSGFEFIGYDKRDFNRNYEFDYRYYRSRYMEDYINANLTVGMRF